MQRVPIFSLIDDDTNSEQEILSVAWIEPNYTLLVSENLVFELERVIFARIDAANCSISETDGEVASVLGVII